MRDKITLLFNCGHSYTIDYYELLAPDEGDSLPCPACRMAEREIVAATVQAAEVETPEDPDR